MKNNLSDKDSIKEGLNLMEKFLIKKGVTSNNHHLLRKFFNKFLAMFNERKKKALLEKLYYNSATTQLKCLWMFKRYFEIENSKNYLDQKTIDNIQKFNKTINFVILKAKRKVFLHMKGDKKKLLEKLSILVNLKKKILKMELKNFLVHFKNYRGSKKLFKGLFLLNDIFNKRKNILFSNLKQNKNLKNNRGNLLKLQLYKLTSSMEKKVSNAFKKLQKNKNLLALKKSSFEKLAKIFNKKYLENKKSCFLKILKNNYNVDIQKNNNIIKLKEELNDSKKLKYFFSLLNRQTYVKLNLAFRKLCMHQMLDKSFQSKNIFRDHITNKSFSIINNDDFIKSLKINLEKLILRNKLNWKIRVFNLLKKKINLTKRKIVDEKDLKDTKIKNTIILSNLCKLLQKQRQIDLYYFFCKWKVFLENAKKFNFMNNQKIAMELKEKNLKQILNLKLKRIFQIKNGFVLIIKFFVFKRGIILNNSFKTLKNKFRIIRNNKVGQRIFIRKIQNIFRKNKAFIFTKLKST